ncbi:MAG: CRISPR-associated endonuclease Cas1 [Fimbriimonadaceae bacterium]
MPDSPCTIDPFNAMLNYGYALLLSQTVQSCESAGLHPDGGYLHADRPGRPSLALDLMEPFRPVLVDRVVLRLVRQRAVQASQAEPDEKMGFRLTEPLRQRLAAEFFREIAKKATGWPSYRHALQRQSQSLAVHLVTGDPFHPYRFGKAEQT